MGVDGVLTLGCRALGIALAGELSSLLLGESMRRGGGRDEPGTWLRSLDDRGKPGKGEKLPGGRPCDRPEDEVVGCIFAGPRGFCYILTLPRTSSRGEAMPASARQARDRRQAPAGKSLAGVDGPEPRLERRTTTA